jgi:hypothetical protein
MVLSKFGLFLQFILAVMNNNPHILSIPQAPLSLHLTPIVTAPPKIPRLFAPLYL